MQKKRRLSRTYCSILGRGILRFVDEPAVQYARTSDGLSIAYMEMGAGYPLVHHEPLVVWF